MTFLQYCSDGPKPEPGLMVIHGREGKGKTNLASGAPNVIFFDIEKGTKNLNVTRAPQEAMKSFDNLLECLEMAIADDIAGYTLVFDSASRAEALAQEKICNDAGAEHISEKTNDKTGFGNGHTATYRQFCKFLDLCDKANEKGAFVIVLAHTMIDPFNDPIGEKFDRYEIALHKAKNGKSESVCDALKRMADSILFIDDVRTVEEKKDGLQKVKKGVGSGARVVYTQERPAYAAKNRYGMPHKIFLSEIKEKMTPEEIMEVNRANFAQISQYIPFFNQEQK